MTQNLTIYNVWHERVFPELLREVPFEDRPHVVLLGVNARIEKEIPDVDNNPDFKGFRLEMEYDLPNYTPVWQDLAYCQTSLMLSLIHI